MILQLLERPLVIADPFERLDAIVVLGAPLSPRGAVTPIVAERIAAAAELFRAGAAPLLVASGGVTASAPRAEADAIAEGLAHHGIPSAAILVERASRTTRDNARLTAELLLPHAPRVWLVTQPFHGRRAARLFRAAGFQPRVWWIPDSRRRLRWLVREYAAWGGLLLRRGGG